MVMPDHQFVQNIVDAIPDLCIEAREITGEFQWYQKHSGGRGIRTLGSG